MIHEYVHLAIPARHFITSSERLARYAEREAAGGKLLGLWSADIGQLNRIVMMRAFDDDADFLAERRSLAVSSDPFGCGEVLMGYSADAYVPFLWLDPVPHGDFGPFYEIRTYGARLGGMPTLIEAWKKKLPTRADFSPCLAAGVSLDGEPRFSHLWPYRSLDDRDRIRSRAAATGMWPPNAFPGSLPTPMQTLICKALPASPLQ